MITVFQQPACASGFFTECRTRRDTAENSWQEIEFSSGGNGRFHVKREYASFRHIDFSLKNVQSSLPKLWT